MRFFLTVAACASSSVAALPETLNHEVVETLTSEDVQELLVSWDLDRVFADAFANVQVDGEALLNTPKSDLEAAFADSNIAAMHWNRLHRRLAPFRDAVAQAEVDAHGLATASANADRFQARRLQDATSVDLTGYSGVRIASNKSCVNFADDMAILRTDEGLTAAAPRLKVEGDVVVTGTLTGSALGSLGSSTYHAAASCRAILQGDSTAGDGVYWITRVGTEDPYEAYCDMTRGGLELVFKVSHGVGGDPYSLWQSGDAVNEDAQYMNVLNNDNYVSSKAKSTWDLESDNFLGVHAHVMEGNRVARYMSFDPSDTDYTSWFSADSLVESDWTDLMTADKNYFSMEGDADNGRRWFVNGNYGGCDVDAGWLVLDDDVSDPCDWEITPATGILYNPKFTSANVEDYYQPADAFAVFVDVDQVFSSCVAALKQLDYAAQDGQYWVTHNDLTDPQLVYCDMTNGGYEMVFKVVHGGGTDAYTLWSDDNYDNSDQSGQNLNPVSTSASYASSWRRDAFTFASVDKATVTDVDVRVITDGATKKFLHFEPDENADDESWFALQYLQGSSWTDNWDEDYNFFGIEGDPDHSRAFFVQRNYGGCAADAGWLVVAGKNSEGCDWEDANEEYPDILYSTKSVYDEQDTMAVADMVAVFYLWE